MQQITAITIEDCFSKTTTATAEALNKRIAEHNAAVAAHAEQAAALSNQNIDVINPEELFNPTFQRNTFALRRAELAIRRALAELFKARAADRRAQVEALFGEIEVAEAAALKAIHRAGWTSGDGKVWDQSAIGNVHPASFRSHPKIVAAHNAHQDAQARANSFHDAQLNVEAIHNLETSLRRMQSAATAA